MNRNLLFDFEVNRENATVNIKREFNASRDLVWEAWTDPAILDQWWAPKPYLSKTKVMDFQVGGRRFYAMVSPEGQEHWGVQEFTLIKPTTNLAWLSSFADQDEEINEALPTSQWELQFSEQDGTTTVDIVIRHQSYEHIETLLQMGFKQGFTMTLGELDRLLGDIK